MFLSRLKEKIPHNLKRNSARALQNAWQSPLHNFFTKKMPFEEIRKIVFVCQGNVCRSVFAEHWLRSQLKDRSVAIESCGLNVDLSTPPPAVALDVSKRMGLDLSSHRSKSFRECDLDKADLILLMQHSHWHQLNEISTIYKKKSFLLRTFAPFPKKLICNIHDPYGLGYVEFQRCFHIIQICLQGVIYRFHLLKSPINA